MNRNDVVTIDDLNGVLETIANDIEFHFRKFDTYGPAMMGAIEELIEIIRGAQIKTID